MIIGRRRTGQGCQVNRVAPMRDGFQFENWLLGDRLIITGELSEGSFCTSFTGKQLSFNNNLAGCGNVDIDRLALDDVDGLSHPTSRDV